jgi:hypothetical protein
LPFKNIVVAKSDGWLGNNWTDHLNKIDQKAAILNSSSDFARVCMTRDYPEIISVLINS